MFYGSNQYRKDKPQWLISNAMETPQVPGSAIRLTAPVIPRWDQAVAGLGGGLGRFGDGLAGRARTTWGLGVAWMIGLPRRGGARLHAMNDAEARWWRWQVAERYAGLVRQYRDARFELLRHDPALRQAGPGAELPDVAPEPALSPGCPCGGRPGDDAGPAVGCR